MSDTWFGLRAEYVVRRREWGGVLIESCGRVGVGAGVVSPN